MGSPVPRCILASRSPSVGGMADEARRLHPGAGVFSLFGPCVLIVCLPTTASDPDQLKWMGLHTFESPAKRKHILDGLSKLWQEEVASVQKRRLAGMRQ